MDDQYQEEGEEEVGRGRAGGQTVCCLGPHAHLQRTSAARASVERFREP